MSFVLAGLDIVEKAKLIEDTFWPLVGGRESFAETAVSLVRSDREDPATNEAAFAHLKITVKDPDPQKVGRAFSNKAIELALAHYPGFHTTAPPQEESPYAVYWPALVPAGLIEQVVHLEGEAIRVGPSAPPAAFAGVDVPVVPLPPVPSGPTVRAPLGRLFGARSGDKGGNANLGVWARSPQAYAWLAASVTPDRLRQLLPECRGLAVERHLLPNLVNTIIVMASLEVARMIILESFLSFLGLGIQPPTPSWGAMLGEGRVYMLTHWWLAAFPGAAIFVTTLGINLFGDGLRDVLDPHRVLMQPGTRAE